MKMFVGLVCALLMVQSDALETRKLSSGQEIPIVGLGTGAIGPDQIDQAVASALENGYRHIDTAFNYGNEAAIGKALKKWFDKGNKREDIFITTKLPNNANRPQSVERYLKKSLQDLGLDYVDMFLIHMPFGAKEGENMQALQKDGYDVLEEDTDLVGLWKAMEAQVKAGRAKSIGVSNFNEKQLAKVYDNAEIKPSNLQVESHLYLQQPNLRKFCKDKNIVMTAYAPLGSQGTRNSLHKGTVKDLPALAELPIIKELAQKYKKTPGQIMLRHTVQSGLVVIPKSTNPARQKENISVFDFELTEEEMKRLNAIDKGELGRVYDFLAWNKDLDKHPQYPFGKP